MALTHETVIRLVLLVALVVRREHSAQSSFGVLRLTSAPHVNMNVGQGLLREHNNTHVVCYTHSYTYSSGSPGVGCGATVSLTWRATMLGENNVRSSDLIASWDAQRLIKWSRRAVALIQRIRMQVSGSNVDD